MWKYYMALDLTPTQRARGDRDMAMICLARKTIRPRRKTARMR